MTKVPKKRTGRDPLRASASDSIFRQTQPPKEEEESEASASVYQQELKWNGYDSLDNQLRGMVQEATRDIQRRLKRTIHDIFQVGKRLNQVKALLPPGEFLRWFLVEFEAEFGFTIRLAEHWMNVAKRFDEDQVEKFAELRFPLSSLYLIAAPSTPPAVADVAIAKAAEQPDKKPKAVMIEQLIRDYKFGTQHARTQRVFKEAGIVPEIHGMLLSTPVAEDAQEMLWLGQFEPRIQAQIAEKISSGQAKSVTQANRLLKQEAAKPPSARMKAASLPPRGRTSPAAFYPRSPANSLPAAPLPLPSPSPPLVPSDPVHTPIAVEVVTPTTRRKLPIKYYAGTWRDALRILDTQTFDFAFVEAPLQGEPLPIYRELARELHRVLKPGAKALITVGHRNIHFIGPYLEPPLRISWTHIAHRQPETVQIQGMSMVSSSMLLSLVYRDPWTPPNSQVADMHAGQDLPVGIESALRYYLSRYTGSGATVLHVVIDPDLCFNLANVVMDSAQRLAFKALVGVGAGFQLDE
ncbi:MAG TPA: hypothetical protein V6D03_12825 [Candidatus Caenarcaniphilales bacterium]